MIWLCSVAALVLGFLFKVLYDELKSPKLRILAISKEPLKTAPRFRAIGRGFDAHYWAYRVKVENTQQRYLNCAAENCVAWLELESTSKVYLLYWVSGTNQLTINVGDVREVVICARGNETGEIVALTGEITAPGIDNTGDYETISNETYELNGELRITSKNGRRAKKRITIKPTDENKLEITLR